MILPVAFDRVPKGWLPCDGRLMPINTNQALYTLLGVQFGGDGRTTFALPDLRGRTPIGANLSALPLKPDQTNVRHGQSTGDYGSEVPVNGTVQFAIDAANLPAHTHGVTIPADKLAAKSTMHATKTVGAAEPVDGAALGKGGAANGQAAIYATATPNVALSDASVKTTLKPVSVTSASTGAATKINAPYAGNLGFSALQESMGINFIICVNGLFPTRN
ncbi:phage tail protein [Massilia sp. CFBP9026]|uniref:phage tail protein n=1 Tax=Massilia sp. CFBP9026 TaxID=3096536 RepID=UPI002A6B5F0F|nr:tail fiber protein [Massilia sp. CFBP9026]MDY0961652.1 tail fiber protein [Massilia sp. CFBP9026]